VFSLSIESVIMTVRYLSGLPTHIRSGRVLMHNNVLHGPNWTSGLMLAIGPDHFRAMLEGFHAIDEHFRAAPFGRNLPTLMGLLAVWYTPTP
jgi:hypothetical protein